MKIAVKVVIVTEGEDFNMVRLFLTEIFLEESVQICSTGEYILKMFFVLLWLVNTENRHTPAAAAGHCEHVGVFGEDVGTEGE